MKILYLPISFQLDMKMFVCLNRCFLIVVEEPVVEVVWQVATVLSRESMELHLNLIILIMDIKVKNQDFS